MHTAGGAGTPDSESRTIGITIDLGQIRTALPAYSCTMWSRRISNFIAKLCLAVMLFAQTAIAFADCDIFLSARLHSLIATDHQSADAPCHEGGANANLCKAHWGEELCLDKPQVKVQKLLAQAVLAWHATSAARRGSVARVLHLEAWAAHPPRILFQPLLI